ncbi:HAD-IC family P-type ATPase [Candidatus Uhrbacteria bacterium]|nr:HAD-IC family P-type ATPase [Candidatus Uhrbacteria bacterium]
MPDEHARPIDEVLSAAETDRELGLTSAEARRRLETGGANALPVEAPPSFARKILVQILNGLNLVLLAAAGISVSLGQKSDAIGILLAVAIDVVIGVVEERKAERAIAKLGDLIVRESTVVRDGMVMRVPSVEVVPGDIMLFEEGDRVAADARLVEIRDFATDESSLTGESSPVVKSVDAVAAKTAVPDRVNMAWMGTAVVRGRARAVVAATGARAEFGKIAGSLVDITRRKTPFEARVDRLGRRLALATIVISALVFVLGSLRGFPLIDMFFFSVALVVSIIPEGLPAVLAIVLAIGVRRMARRNAIVRHLPSVETLGVADVICSDKTGTITENKMTVRRIFSAGFSIDVSGEGWMPRGEFTVGGRRVMPAEIPALDRLLAAAALCPTASIEWHGEEAVVIGEPTEAALLTLAAKGGFEREAMRSSHARIDDLPFSSQRKYRAVLEDAADVHGVRSRGLFVVGAYEVIMERSASAHMDGTRRPLDAGLVRQFDDAHQAMARQALRVLAVAAKPMPRDQESIGDGDVGDLTILGIVGMIDPPRPGVAGAIERCRQAGIRVMMLTGDHRETAAAVAKEIGLLPKRGSAGAVLTDAEVAGMSDADFRKAVAKAAVFARVSPATKLRIVRVLEEQGHTVAMTGDGVNDAPALKQASIGIAMGIAGTDVAREVSEMVLADDNFVSIVAAVEEGRVVFRNVKQTVAYLFTTNIGEAATIVAGMALGMPLPLLPAQILWLNLVTDGFPDVALAVEPTRQDALAEPPRPRKAPIITKNTWLIAVFASVTMCAGTLGLFAAYLPYGLAYAQSVAFTCMAMFQLWNVFAMRSARESLAHLGIFTNPAVTAAVAISLALQLAVLYVPGLAQAFRTVPLSAGDWLVIIPVSATSLVVVETYKIFVRRGIVPREWL